MSFVQLAFFSFLPVTLVAYHSAWGYVRLQQFILLAASMFFYAWWDWRFLGWLLVSIGVAYAAAIAIERGKHKKLALAIGISVLLLILVYFKYMNFFVASFVAMLRSVGFEQSVSTLQIILPIGISFYTFQAIAYMMDVYRKEIRAETDVVLFATFKIFFPQLVAGPIERAAHLLPQIAHPREVDRVMVQRAVWIIVLGYFMKVGIADVLAPYVELAFSSNQPSGWWTLFGTYSFGLQIYGDFLGYSLIARGVALLFGIELIWNFDFPYWSTSLVQFWRRWHISLSRWLRDYLYIPLGGSHVSTVMMIRNLMVTMVLGGLWHGANWTFVLWGCLHGGALSVDHLLRRKASAIPVHAVIGWLSAMAVVFAGWFIFRITSLSQGATMLSGLEQHEVVPRSFRCGANAADFHGPHCRSRVYANS